MMVEKYLWICVFGVHVIAPEIDSEIAAAKLNFHGVHLDRKELHQEDSIDDLLRPEV